jgi:hypothetical protein
VAIGHQPVRIPQEYIPLASTPPPHRIRPLNSVLALLCMPNSLVSHTYTHRVRNPFISHTYAKTGGCTPSMFHVESNSAIASTYLDLSTVTRAEAELTFLSHFHSQLHAADCRQISVCLPVSSFTASLTQSPPGTPPLRSDQNLVYLVEVADLKIGHYIRQGGRYMASEPLGVALGTGWGRELL